jgi:glycosyltransferase involved in cell wall biosynthesis
MRILIAAVSFSGNISGLERHALNLARCLLLRPEISELHFVVGPWQGHLMAQAGPFSDIRFRSHVAELKRSRFSRNHWYYRRLPELAAQLKADVVHYSFPMPLNARAFSCPTVMTLHDLYPYEIPMNFGFPKFFFNRIVLHQCLRAADAIACVSEATRIRLKSYETAAVWRKAARIYNYVEPAPPAEVESPIPGWKKEPFLLCIAQHRRNKNIPTLIAAFDRMLRYGWIGSNSKLIIVGNRGPETTKVHRLANQLGVRDHIHFLEGISEPELQWCYRHCEALVAPSLTEGFGAPVAEGMIAGCRIVCSDIPAHREVGDEFCRFVDLSKNPAESLAAVIADSLKQAKPRSRHRPQMTAAAQAEQFVGLYRSLVDSAMPMRSGHQDDSDITANSEANALSVPHSESALAYRRK